MTWRIWSPVGSTSSSNESFETSSHAASALCDEQQQQVAGGCLGLTTRPIRALKKAADGIRTHDLLHGKQTL